MPICPFCRKPVETSSIWCSCGANLARYPNLPVSSKNVNDWLAKYEPELLNSSWSGDSILEKAKRQLISGQDNEVSTSTKINAEMNVAKGLIKTFLADCQKEGLAPTIDIGSLRRDRWRQWKRIPAEYRQHPPLKNFKETPGYFFEASVVDFKDEYCLGIDGSIYKHQLNAPDPFELEELLSIVPARKLADALTAALVELFRAKQQPEAGQKQARGTAAIEDGSMPEAAEPKRRLRLPFGRTDSKVGNEPADQKTVEVNAQIQVLDKSEKASSESATTKETEKPSQAAPAPAVSATPRRRVNKADRRTGTAAKAATPERRSAKTDRRAAGASKEPAAVPPESRTNKVPAPEPGNGTREKAVVSFEKN